MLGNGPGLCKAALDTLPDDCLLVGVNASICEVWSPISVTMDGLFYDTMQKQFGHIKQPLVWIIRQALRVAEPTRENQKILDGLIPKRAVITTDESHTAPSGCFGVWFACEVLDMERVFLLGFGGTGHFESSQQDYEKWVFNRDAGAFQLNHLISRIYREVAFVYVWKDGHHQEAVHYD